MDALDKFLICYDLLPEDDLEYIFHTQQPRVLFKVLQENPDDYKKVDFEIVQEYDPLADCSQQQIDDIMEEMKEWYIDVCKSYNGDDIPELKTPVDFKYVELDDAYFMSLMNNEYHEFPKPEKIETVSEMDYVKVSKNGEQFWCMVWYINKSRNELFVAIYEELLLTPLHGLKHNDGIIIEPHHIYEISRGS